MPLIPVSPAQRQNQQGVNPRSSSPLRADMDSVVIEAKRTTPDFHVGLGPLSDKARRRGGEYHLGHGIQDATGGLLKGAALIPDGVLNLIARRAEVARGLEKGSLGRDFLNRSLRAGNYEDVDWLVEGLIGMAKEGEDLGTGSRVGNVLERTGEFAAIAIPFAGALNAMAQASRASKALAAGQTTFRAADNVGRGGVGLAIPGQSPVSAAGRSVGVGFQPTTGLGKLGDIVLAPYRVRPTNAWGLGGAGNTEMLFGGLSGLGAGIEQEYYGGSGLTGGLVAPLATGLLYSPTMWAGRTIFGAANKARGEIGTLKEIQREGGIGAGTRLVANQEASAGAREKVGEVLRAIEADPRFIENEEFMRRVGEEFGDIFNDPDLPLNIAQILGDPQLVAQTRAIIKQGGPDAVREQERITNGILQKLQNHYNDKLSVEIGIPTEEGMGSASFVLSRLNDELDATLRGVTDEAGDIQTSIAQLLEGRLDQQGRAALGENIRNDMLQARTRAFELAEEEAKRLGLNTVDQLSSAADFETFALQMREAFLPVLKEDSLSYRHLNPLIREIIDEGGRGTRLSFQDWKNYRQLITDQLSAMYASGNAGQARNLKLFAQAWDDFGKNQSANLGQTYPKFESYQKWYQANVAGPLENNIVVNTLRKAGGAGDNQIYQTMPENVAGQYLNSVDGLKTFTGIFGPNGISPNTAQMDNLRKAMYDKATAAAYKGDGSFNKESLDIFINDNNAVLNELGLLDEFTTVSDDFKNNLSQRLAEVNQRADAINQSKVFRLLSERTNYEGVDTPGTLFEKIFNNTNRDEVRELARLAKNAGVEVEKKWNGLVLDNLMKKVYPDQTMDFSTNPEALLKFINNRQNRQLLDNALGTEHTDRLQLLAEFGDRVNSIMRTESGTSDLSKYVGVPIKTILDEIAGSVGTSIPQMTTRFIAIQEGRIGMRAALAYLAARGLNAGSTARFQAVMAEALTNPVFARELMKDITTGPAVGMNPRAERMVNDFYFQRNIPAEVTAAAFRRFKVPATQVGTGELQNPIPNTEQVTEEIVEEIPATSPNVSFQPPAPPPAFTPPAPPPATPPPPQGIAAVQPTEQEESVSFEELFPFDTTGQAIQRRRSGIGSLV